MSTIEDRLHAAARAVADTVTADSVPPLGLSGGPSSANGKPPRRNRRGFALLAPLAAAAAVVAVIVPSVALSGGTHAQGTAASSSASLRSVPPYYVEIIRSSRKHNYSYAIVRDTLTGARLATIRVPKPFKNFESVTGAAGDRTFVLTATRGSFPAPSGPAKLFLARFNASTRAVTLRALPVPEITKPEVLYGVALSPSGTELAISVQTSHIVVRVSVYSLTTGAVRSWQHTGFVGSGPYDSVALSWSSRGTLAFNWYQPFAVDRPASTFLLNTATAGGNLIARSRQVVRWANLPDGFGPQGDAVVTPDGTKIVAPVFRATGPFLTGVFAIEEFSAATGRVVRILDKTKSDWFIDSVEWTNPSGSVLVVGMPAKPGGKAVLGVLRGNKLTPIPVGQLAATPGFPAPVASFIAF